ncbi:hypothetical protein [Aliikangiella sp. IMCC44359]|uniref:hypothetical protein n=1 Tax=Aliikangiella sp. IMCC44359 TaxID=3459125 RepID=UPI00403AECDF
MRHLIFIIICIFCFLTTNVNAENKWTGGKKIQSVQIVEHGGIIIYFDSEVNPTCTNAGTSSIYVYKDQVGMTDDGVKAFLSSSLTALTTGMTVDAMYDDSTSLCWGKYLVISK